MAKLRRAITTAPQPVRGETLVVTEDLIARFIAHTRAAPDKIAIITSQQSLTYQQLYQDVLYWKSLLNQYTHSRVIICLDRSPHRSVFGNAMVRHHLYSSRSLYSNRAITSDHYRQPTPTIDL